MSEFATLDARNPKIDAVVPRAHRRRVSKLTIDISDELLALIRQLSGAAGMSMRRYVVYAINEKIAREAGHETPTQET